MFADFLGRARSAWRPLNRLDRVALVVLLLYAVAWPISRLKRALPGSGFLSFLFFLALGYFLFRFLSWARSRVLWSLRNRLIVAYVFIAVVPVLLLLAMAALSASIIYSQLGAYLLNDDLQKFVEKVEDAAEDTAASLAAQRAALSQREAASLTSLARASDLRAELPGLQIDTSGGQEILQRKARPGSSRFAGIVQAGDRLLLMAVISRPAPGGRVVVSATVPVTSELLERVAPYLGPIQLLVTRPVGTGDVQGVVYSVGERRFQPAGRIGTRERSLQPPAYWFDFKIEGVSKPEAVSLESTGSEDETRPVFASFSARPSQLNRRLFSSLGELGGVYFQFLIAIGVVFLLLEVAALATGIVLTRTITHAVADLYRATQYVRAGDFTHRVRVPRKDQLGELGESFNSMTSSISALIEEQRQRQRLENELAIAREVQAQLFPQTLPSLPGIQLQAICRAARVVSGDYYDFIRLGPTRLGIALADVSGKGISAALVMASLQAALRNQALLDGRGSKSPAEVVSRLNRHLFLNTSEDRFATLFYAIYDTATRTLRYTNAGHLPPFCLVGDQVIKLEEGGMVVGVFEDCEYAEGTIQTAPGSVFLAYSDGLTEPENVYGEEFGARRLVDVALRHRAATPQVLAEMLLSAAEEWSGSPDRADDMTLIVARLE